MARLLFEHEAKHFSGGQVIFDDQHLHATRPRRRSAPVSIQRSGRHCTTIWARFRRGKKTYLSHPFIKEITNWIFVLVACSAEPLCCQSVALGEATGVPKAREPFGFEVRAIGRSLKFDGGCLETSLGTLARRRVERVRRGAGEPDRRRPPRSA